MAEGTKNPFDELSDEELRDMAVKEGVLEGTSGVESAARGAAQGLSLGFADEIAAGVESTFTEKTYEDSVAESRENFRRAETDNPVAFTGGDIAGSIAGGLALPAGLGAKVAGNVALGAASAVGRSEDKSVADAAIGGALGLGGDLLGKAVGRIGQKVASGFTKKLSNLQQSQVFEALGAKTGSAVGGMRKKLLNNGIKDEGVDDFLNGILDFKITKLKDNGQLVDDFVISPKVDLAENYSRLSDFLHNNKAGVGKQISEYIEAANHELDPQSITNQLKSALNDEFEREGYGVEAEALEKMFKEIDATPSLNKEVIDLKELQRIKTKLASTIKWEGEAGSKGVQLYRKKTADHLNTIIENSIESKLDVASDAAFLGAKKQYRQGKIALDLMASEARKSTGILGQIKEQMSITGSIAGVSGFVLTGNPLLAAGLSLAANKVVRSTTLPVGAARVLNSKAVNSLLRGVGEGIPRYQSIARRMVAASSRLIDTFETEFRAGLAEVSLTETPLSRTSAEAFNRQHELVPLVKQMDFTTGKALETAFQNEDAQMVSSILSGLSTNPKARKLVQEGRGWDGKAVTEEEIQSVRAEIETSDVPYSVKLKLLSDFDKSKQIPNMQEIASTVTRGNRESALKPRRKGRKVEEY